MALRISGNTIAFVEIPILERTLYSVVPTRFRTMTTSFMNIHVKDLAQMTEATFLGNVVPTNTALGTILWHDFLLILQNLVVAYNVNPTPARLTEMEALVQSW
jgi:hypothetical protein